VESGQDARRSRSTWPPAWSQARERLQREGYPACEVDAALHDSATKAAGHESDYTAQAVYAAACSRLGERRKAQKPAARPLAGVVASVAPVAARIGSEIEQLRPAPIEAPDLRPGESLTHAGRPRTPWRDFADAGLVPRHLFAANGWDLLAMVWRYWDSGIGPRERQTPRTGFHRFMPGRVAGMKRRTARRWASDLARWGFVEESPDPSPDRCRLLRPAWPLKPDPAAYLRECVERMRAERKPGRKVAACWPHTGRLLAASPPASISAQVDAVEAVAGYDIHPSARTYDLGLRTKTKRPESGARRPEEGEDQEQLWAGIRRLARWET
jgi:hypothetical protein